MTSTPSRRSAAISSADPDRPMYSTCGNAGIGGAFGGGGSTCGFMMRCTYPRVGAGRSGRNTHLEAMRPAGAEVKPFRTVEWRVSVVVRSRPRAASVRPVRKRSERALARSLCVSCRTMSVSQSSRRSGTTWPARRSCLRSWFLFPDRGCCPLRSSSLSRS